MLKIDKRMIQKVRRYVVDISDIIIVIIAGTMLLDLMFPGIFFEEKPNCSPQVIEGYTLELRNVKTQQASLLLANGILQAKTNRLETELRLQSRYRRVTVTGYPPLPEYTSPDPLTTASTKRVRLGGVAVCPQMHREGWAFHRKVYLKGCGKFDGIHEILDLIAPMVKGVPCENRVDIFRWTLEEAKEIYCENAEIVLLGEA